MSVDYIIVPLEEKHIQGAAIVEQTCFSQPWSEGSFLGELLRGDTAMFAAVSQGKVIGWAGLEYVCGEGSVTNIAVLPDFRGNGIGEALTHMLIQRSRELSLSRLTLEVRQSNSAAVALYEKLGFLHIGKRPDFYSYPREAALMMNIIFKP